MRSSYPISNSSNEFSANDIIVVEKKKGWQAFAVKTAVYGSNVNI